MIPFATLENDYEDVSKSRITSRKLLQQRHEPYIMAPFSSFEDPGLLVLGIQSMSDLLEGPV